MCIMGSASQGAMGLEELTPKQPLPHQTQILPPAPAPGVWSLSWSWGRHHQPPGNSDRWEREKVCWNEALKKQRWRQEQ